MAKRLFSHLIESRDPSSTNGKGNKVNRLPTFGALSTVETLNPLSDYDPLGYTTGAGGSVTQGTSKATTVVLNKLCGQITTHNATLNAATEVSFTLTNSKISSTDVVIVNIGSGATADSYSVDVTAVATGSCRIQISNVSAGNLGEALVLNFAIIKATA